LSQILFFELYNCSQFDVFPFKPNQYGEDWFQIELHALLFGCTVMYVRLFCM